MTDHQARARELLDVVADMEADPNIPRIMWPSLAAELRAALDRETALMVEVERLRPGILITSGEPFKVENCTFDNTPPSAFTGRQTGRNRADIPSDAEVFDESGFGSGMTFSHSDPQGDDK